MGCSIGELLCATGKMFWQDTVKQLEVIEEIHLGIGQPVLLKTSYGEFFLTEKGELSSENEDTYYVRSEFFEELLAVFCKDSLYAYEECMGNGYFTLPEGHRVGVVGEVILTEEGKIRGMKSITGLNIRIRHDVRYEVSTVLDSIRKGALVENTLLISPPGCGKTTCLRELIRGLSNGTGKEKGLRVGVVDEREELSTTCEYGNQGLGIRTDVLRNCPKAQGMMLLIRSMSPQVLVVDEIGKREDFLAILEASRCGVSVIASIHGDSLAQVRDKMQLWELRPEQCFQRFFCLYTRQEKTGRGSRKVFWMEETENVDASTYGSGPYFGWESGNGTERISKTDRTNSWLGDFTENSAVFSGRNQNEKQYTGGMCRGL